MYIHTYVHMHMHEYTYIHLNWESNWIKQRTRSLSKSHFWLVLTFDGLTFVRQRFFGWLGRGTTPWEFLNQLISNLPFNTIFISYQHSPFCHCKSTLYLYSTYCCHCNIHLTFSNTSFHSNINKLQLSIKTITRTGTHTHTSAHITCKLYTYIHTWSKNNKKLF